MSAGSFCRSPSIGTIVSPRAWSMPAIMAAAAEAGAQFAGSTVVRLPWSVKDIFSAWLDNHFPDRKDKVLGRIRDMQGGTLSHQDFGTRLKGEGIWAEQIRGLVRVSMKRAGIPPGHAEVSAGAFRRPRSPDGQMELF